MSRRSIGTSHRGNMRHGLISLLTVVVVISLATAAVLAVATSHAMEALSQRQARMTTEGYDAERSAQTFLAELDDALSAARLEGVTDSAALMERIQNRANLMLAEACTEDVTATYSVEDANVRCTFVTASGKMLQTDVAVDENATLRIVSWKLTAAPQIEDDGDTLWGGPTAEE